jgi:exonuclease VII small subunit
MSTTPRTDEVYNRQFAPEKPGITWYELSKQLETELAAARVKVEQLRKRNELLTDHYECKMSIPERVSNIETELTAMTLRAEKAEAAIATMTTEFGKMVLSAAARADRNVDLRRRAEKAEAALAKAKATIEDICTGGRLTCDQCLETMPCNCGHSPRRL